MHRVAFICRPCLSKLKLQSQANLPKLKSGPRHHAGSLLPALCAQPRRSQSTTATLEAQTTDEAETVKTREDGVGAKDPGDDGDPVKPVVRGMAWDTFWDVHRTEQWHKSIQNVYGEQRVQAMKRWKKWKKDMAKAERGQQRQLKGDKPRPRHKDDDWRCLRELLDQGGAAGMTLKWQELPLEQRESQWLGVMAYALRFEPERAHVVLEATMEQGVTPSYAVSDAVHFITTWFSRLPSRKHEMYASTVPVQLMKQSLQTLKGIEHTQESLYLAIRQLKETRDVADLFTALRKAEHHIHQNTLLQFTSRFARDPQFKPLALDVIRGMLKEGQLDINSLHGAAACTSLLAFSKPVEDAKILPAPEKQASAIVGEDQPSTATDHQSQTSVEDLFQSLLELGMRPNVITFTGVIRTFCLEKRFDVALRVYSSMLEMGIVPDDHLYSILLAGARRSSSLETAMKIIRDIHAWDCRDAVVWNDLLRTILTFAVAEANPEDSKPTHIVPAFPRMLQAYLKKFDAKELHKLTLIPDLEALLPHNLQYSDSERNRWEWESQFAPLLDDPGFRSAGVPQTPGSDTLCIMLIGYIKSLSNPQSVLAFYTNIRNLIKSGDETVNKLIYNNGAYNTFLHDSVIKKLSEWPGMMRAALDVVGDMLKDNLVTKAASPETKSAKLRKLDIAAKNLKVEWGLTDSSEKDEPDKAFTGKEATEEEAGRQQNERISKHPPPSKYTWSILVHGFMHSGNPEQAESVLRLMREQGVEPNNVTLNTLAAGYSRMANVKKTVETVILMEKSGYEPDDYTTRTMLRLPNPELALTMLEKAKEREKERIEVSEEDKERMAAKAARIAKAKEQMLQQQQNERQEMAGDDEADWDALIQFQSLDTPKDASKRRRSARRKLKEGELELMDEQMNERVAAEAPMIAQAKDHKQEKQETTDSGEPDNVATTG